MPNNVEVLVNKCHILRQSFKGRLLGIMTNAAAQAVRNTPNIGRRMITGATMPYEELGSRDMKGMRIVIANPEKQIVLITPVVNRRPYTSTIKGYEETEYDCGKDRHYLIRKLAAEAENK